MPERYTDAQIEGAIEHALANQNVAAIPGLIAVLALQNPERAEHVRGTILLGLSIATNGLSQGSGVGDA